MVPTQASLPLGDRVLSLAMANIRIGTSGWHYKHWVGKFYAEKFPASKMLAYYYEKFDTVEINNSFYMLPKIETLSGWREATPRNFEFAIKASRFLTHNKKLKEPENALNNFLPRAEALGKKLGPILFQLPPKWGINLERLSEFLEALPKYHRYTFEFRELSWLTDSVYELLRQHNVAFCIYELAGFHSPIEITADWAYVRLHGPGGKYQGSYSDKVLQQWAERIADWSTKLRSVYVYFDNDQAGYAALNALTLKKMVAQRLSAEAA
ncbi:MAG TPA: DUF72 domain-containing protein [Terriglobales bacterium]|nr:DUF72 domain-containing protein [Terriglobales bacterium]